MESDNKILQSTLKYVNGVFDNGELAKQCQAYENDPRFQIAYSLAEMCNEMAISGPLIMYFIKANLVSWLAGPSTVLGDLINIWPEEYEKLKQHIRAIISEDVENRFMEHWREKTAAAIAARTDGYEPILTDFNVCESLTGLYSGDEGPARGEWYKQLEELVPQPSEMYGRLSNRFYAYRLDIDCVKTRRKFLTAITNDVAKLILSGTEIRRFKLPSRSEAVTTTSSSSTAIVQAGSAAQASCSLGRMREVIVIDDDSAGNTDPGMNSRDTVTCMVQTTTNATVYIIGR